MSKDEIIRIAVQCQLVTTGNRDGFYMDALERFAALVAAAERKKVRSSMKRAFRRTAAWIRTDECKQCMELCEDADSYYNIKARVSVKLRGETK